MKPLIEVKALSKKYRSTFAIQDISLNIYQNDVYGVIGPSGAGKSTLIRSLARLIVPSSGQILVENDPIESIEGKKLRAYHQSIGMIFQHFNLMGAKTVAENVGYPLDVRGAGQAEKKRRVDELLEFVNLTEKKGAYPAMLSGGQKQRVGIARALANEPKLLFCDEATSALDPKSTNEILKLLKSIQNTTIILITHDMNVIKAICNRVAIIEEGRIVEEGKVEEVFFNPSHPTTKRFIQSTSHEIPKDFFKPESPNRKLLRLRFRGKAAAEPIIAQLVQKFQTQANILLGWIDQLQAIVIGTLIIELNGEPQQIQKSLEFLEDNEVHYEVLENEQ